MGRLNFTLKTGPVQKIAAGLRQYSLSSFQAPSGFMTIFLFFPDFSYFEIRPTLQRHKGVLTTAGQITEE
jgi:hypothetical protein